MKKIIFSLFIIPVAIFAQNPIVEWAKTFGGSKTEFARSITVTKDNKYLIAGNTWSSDGDVESSHGLSDAWLIKLDENGIVLWKKTYGGSGSDVFANIIQTHDDGFILVGSTNSTDGDVPRDSIRGVWIVKIDSIGNIQWQKRIGGSKGEIGLSVFQTQNGDYILGAYSSSSDYDFPQNAGEQDWWVLKLNNQGSIVWKKRIGGSKSDLLSELVNIDDKTFAIAGSTYSYYDGDFVGAKGDFSVKMDTSGNILWKRSFGSPFDTLSIGLKEFHAITMSKNDIVSVGMMIVDLPPNTPIPYTWQYLVTKSDTAGNRKWSKLFGGSETENAKSVKSFPNGDILVTGFTQSNDGDVQNNHGNLDFWIVRLDSLGTLKNANCYGGSKEDQAYSSVIDKKGNVLVVGYSYSTDGTFTQNKGMSDWAIVKLRYPGTSVKESLMDENAIIEYPNPVHDQLVIRISQNIAPNLSIYDIFGKRMYSSSHLKSETTIDMSTFPNGMYIMTYQLGGETFSRKIVKMQ